MAKPPFIELSPRDRLPILYEDRSVLAIDKPPGWMLVPISWQKTDRNLQAAIISSIAAGDFWARSRNLKFLKYVHRLDAETSGVLLFAKGQGALETFGDLFETRKMEKVYFAVTDQLPKDPQWTCRLPIAPDAGEIGRMTVDEGGKSAETAFRVITSFRDRHLIEARPYSGRQHQIRLHLARSGSPIIGDRLYGGRHGKTLGLRAAGLAYEDPFTRRPVQIRAPMEDFLRLYGFSPEACAIMFQTMAAERNSRAQK